MRNEVILSLCDYSHVWGSQYEDAYHVVYVDLQHGADVRLQQYQDNVRGIIAQPPCTEFAGSGARHWERKGEAKLIEGLELVGACCRIILACRPQWWVLENPVGRLIHYLGPWTATYNPCDYGDPYTKRTCLWGEFTMPNKNPVPATEGSKMHLVPPGPERQNIRSETPRGFAEAFRMVNP